MTFKMLEFISHTIISHTMEHCMAFKMLGFIIIIFIIIIILTPLFKLRSREKLTDRFQRNFLMT